MDIDKQPLEGARVRLEPLHAGHLPALAEAIRDGELWRIPVTFVPHPDELRTFLQNADEAFLAGHELTFATFDKATGALVGSTRFMKIDITHRRVEIGFTFLAGRFQRTHVNTEAKYLMLRHAFERWGCHRVELYTDVLNDKSRRAIARIGAQQEGILRSHMVMRDGRVRDSVVFGMTARDWPEAKLRLEAMLGGTSLSNG